MIVRRVARLALPVERDLLAVPGLDVAVDAVVGDVELAADEPLRERGLPVEHLPERLRPGQPLRLLGPEPIAVGVGALVPLFRGVGLLGETFRRREAAALGGQVVQRGSRHLLWPPRRGAPDASATSPGLAYKRMTVMREGADAHRPAGQVRTALRP